MYEELQFSASGYFSWKRMQDETGSGPSRFQSDEALLGTLTHQSHVHSANNEAALSFLTAGVPECLQNTAFRFKKSHNFV
jgi:hypothetical protein